jgi:Secretion system C-terminal sorting domain
MPEQTKFSIKNAIRWIALTILMFAVLLLAAASANAATLYSISNGVWGNTAIWSYTAGGASCGCIPASSDNIIINHHITLDRHLANISGGSGITGILTINAGASLSGGNTYDVDIRAGGTLNLCGTLVARNMTFSNGSFVNVCSTGVMTVNGNFENKNNSDNVIINGSMTVGGSFTNGNGGVIGGSGSIVITNGPVYNTGTSFGCDGGGCSIFPCGFSDTNCGGVPLPVNLIAFNAYCGLSGTRTIQWTTASEVNNDFFSVERSADGIYFETAARMPGAGTTSQTNYYAWTDQDASAGGSFYYRLRQTDFDGRNSLSGVISSHCRNENKTGLLKPNPASDFVLIAGSSFSGESTIRLTDTPGQTVREQKIAAGEEFRLDLSGLENGIYVVSISNPHELRKEKLIIHR